MYKFCSGIFLAGVCGCGLSGPSVSEFSDPEQAVSVAQAPDGARPGSCWGRETTPAEIQTVRRQIPLPGGGFETRISQEIVKERRDYVFEVPCNLELTPEFIASLQRALRARDAYSGLATGRMDRKTRDAVRVYQQAQGVDTSVLTLSTAQSLGLSVVREDQL